MTSIGPMVEKWASRSTCIEKYMDDITITTSMNEADHTEAIMDILQVAKDHNLYFKPEKCTFHASHIDYLGVILEKGMIHMDPVKIEGIRNWPIPTKVKDVCSFLGFCNFYCPFIPNYAHDTKPLNELTKKDMPWQWGSHQQEAMDKLKTKVAHQSLEAQNSTNSLKSKWTHLASPLSCYNTKKTTRNTPLRIILQHSVLQNTTTTFMNLSTLPFIVHACMHWRPFLAGSPHKVIVWSDHQNLTYWKDPQKLSQCIARQQLDLMEYDIEI